MLVTELRLVEGMDTDLEIKKYNKKQVSVQSEQLPLLRYIHTSIHEGTVIT